MLYALGEEHRIVGISGFTVRPARARHEKPTRLRLHQREGRSILTSARPGDRLFRHAGRHRAGADQGRRRGLDQQPPLGRRHPRLRAPARRDGRRGSQGAGLCRGARSATSSAVRTAAAALPRRPRVYFEEWDEPQISAIRWVSELVGIAGGDDIFPAARRGQPRPRPHRRRPGERSSRWRPTSSSARGAARNFGPSRCAARPGWAGDPGRARRRAARDQVTADPAAGAGRADRRTRRAARDDRALGRPPLSPPDRLPQMRGPTRIAGGRGRIETRPASLD